MEGRTERKIKDFPFNKENPFMPNLLVPKRNKTVAITSQTSKELVDKFTGEVDDTLFIATKKEVDKEEFVKIFQSQLQAIFNLSKPAQKICAYVMSVTDFHDRIIFELDDCKKFTGYTSNEAVYKGLAELLDNELIARASASNLYFINPQVFYKGDRIVLITEYRKKKLPKMANPAQTDLFK